jgi:EmrB/QacA subfamily drug resistance transporter
VSLACLGLACQGQPTERGLIAMHRKWWTLLAVCTAIFMLLIDITVVNVALPNIQRSLTASFSELQWVVDAYALTLAALLLSAGSLADRLGRRKVFLIGLALFTAASLWCGLSNTAVMLDVARGAQGIGGAIMFSTSLSLLAQEFEGRERGIAFGIWGATTGAAVAIGPLVGGVLTEAWGWEWIFFVNAPIGVSAIALTISQVRESRDPMSGRLDFPGLITFSGALFCLVFGLIRANIDGWASTPILTLFVAAAALSVAFVVVELRQSDPMFDLSLFQKPSFIGASTTAITLSGSIFALFLYLTLYMQNVLGFSPLGAGLRFLPISLLSFAVAPLAGKLSQVVALRFLLGTGLALIGLGLVLMSGLSQTSQWTALLPGFIVAGIGIGVVNAPLASAAISVAPRARSGMASGVNSTFRQIGIATGIAALGAVFQSQVAQQLAERLTGTPSGANADALAAAVASGGARQAIAGMPQAQQATIVRVAHESFVVALHDVLLIGAIVAFVGAGLALVLMRRRDILQTQAVAAEGQP